MGFPKKNSLMIKAIYICHDKSTISNDWCILVQILVQAFFICAIIKAQKRRYYGNTNKYSNHFK